MPRKVALAVAVLAAAVVMVMKVACQTRRLNADDILKFPADAPTAKISYGAAPQQFAELRLPSGNGPFPVVVVIHGGCWIQYATTQYTAHLASELVKQGWATWNLEYRRAHEPGGGWPDTFADVGQGIDALRDAAKSHPLDISRVAVMGHSAGGQLALWAAGRRRIPSESALHTADPLPLRGAVSLAGIADMQSFAQHGPDDCAAGALRVMGGPREEHPERYAAASPIELLPLGTQQVLVWGEEDTIVPEALFRDYETRAREAGDKIEVVRIPGAGHHELCSAEGAAWKEIVAHLKKVLE